jgi:hypothetical protein
MGMQATDAHDLGIGFGSDVELAGAARNQSIGMMVIAAGEGSGVRAEIGRGSRFIRCRLYFRLVSFSLLVRN